MNPDIPPPIEPIDAAALLAQVNAATGANLSLVGPARGGEVGAAFVRWPDGRDGVLTLSGPTADTVRRTATRLEHARARGIPCPTYDLVVALPGNVAVIQDRLPGNPPDLVDSHVVRQMVALNDRFAAVLENDSTAPDLELYLRYSGPGFCLHESLASYDHRTQELLDWIHQVGHNSPPLIDGDDLVHPDFHPGNVLLDDRRIISGIIDWDAAPRGDRHFALVTLAFDLGWRNRFRPAQTAVSAAMLAALDDRLDRLNQDVLRAYWAHMSLRLVDWSIRHHTNREVDHYLAFSRQRMT